MCEVKNILSYFQDLPGMTIEIEPTDQEEKAFIKDKFRFTPSLSWFFVQDKNADFSLAHSNIIKTTMAL